MAANAEVVKTNRNGYNRSLPMSYHEYSKCFHVLLALLVFSSFPCFGYLATAKSTDAENGSTVLVNVGLVLNTGTFMGKMASLAINISHSDFYAKHPDSKTRLVLHVRNSKNDVLTAAAAAADLIHSVQAKVIIGPETSMEAQFVVQIGQAAHVPIISYSATSPSLSPVRSPYFIRAAPDDSSQVQAIISIMEAYNWKQAVPIYVNNEFGGGMVPYLADALQAIGADMPYKSVIPSSASDADVASELYKLMTMQTRVFIVHMDVTLGHRLFSKAEQIGMMTRGYVWIITNGMANMLDSYPDREDLFRSMQGVLGVKSYVPASETRHSFEDRWRKNFSELQQEKPTNHNVDHQTVMSPINAYGIWAYDAATALAVAVEEQYHQANRIISDSSAEDTDHILSDLGVSISQEGPQLLKAILACNFTGLSGDYDLVRGQLQPSVFDLINIQGSGMTKIEVWRTGSRLQVKKLLNSSVVLLPGNPSSTPAGWVIPTNGKELRIGVPEKDGFNEFVKVTRDPDTNVVVEVTGFCIDVFDAVIAALPYSVRYHYIPIPLVELGYVYDDLARLVYYQKYDAVVGDVSIVTDRTKWADFALPYTDSGVVMVSPIKEDNRKKALDFTRPLSPALWATTFSLFIFIAFVIWVLEHPINTQFRGPWGHQVGTSLYYSFSTLAFAQGQHVYSNLGRLVVIVWIFVVLILTQSYTASLTSILTVQNLEPLFLSVSDVKEKNVTVGYQEGSFVKDFLSEHNLIENNSLQPYKSIKEMHDLFSKGLDKGGIAVAFDEIAFVNALISKYGGSKYTTVGPVYPNGGFGFAFPRGSHLVSDISRAILNVTDGEEMTGIMAKWFPDPSATSLISTKLDLDHFWVLFVISGLVAACALLIFVISFLYEHRSIWLLADPDVSIYTRIKGLLRIFDQRNLRYHTFKTDQPELQLTSTAPNTPCDPQSPQYSYYSDRSEQDRIGDMDEQSILPEHDVPSSSDRNPNQEQPIVQDLPRFYRHDGDLRHRPSSCQHYP